MADETLVLSTLDAATGRPTPARIEVLDPNGRAHLAQDALVVPGDCADHPTPQWLTLEESLEVLPRAVENLYTQTTQFYSAGRCGLPLGPGRYTVRAFKGPEYRTTRLQVDVSGPTPRRNSPRTLGGHDCPGLVQRRRPPAHRPPRRRAQPGDLAADAGRGHPR